MQSELQFLAAQLPSGILRVRCAGANADTDAIAHTDTNTGAAANTNAGAAAIAGATAPGWH